MRLGWVPFVASITGSFFSVGSANPTCKCLSYETCWPSASEFSLLASQLSQPLIKPVPFASACYPPSHPSGNCTNVLTHLADGRYRSKIPGAMEAINFETFIFENGTIDACYYNTTLGFPCEQGNIPVLGVEAREVSDIQAGVKFAAKHNLRLVIKNTGHDYLGRSMARGALMIWTHNLKNISYDDHFVPSGAPPTQTYHALTLHAGVQWFEAYEAANRYKRTIVGGLSDGASVGAAGGWIQGGGHSALSPKFGLGVDHAIQFTVVLASGEYVTATEYRHSDLFWALRGGGGGTYGVVVSVTYRTHDIFPVTGILFQINTTTAESALNVTTEYFKLHPGLSDAGWGGYSFFAPPNLQAIYIAPNVSEAQVNATLTPFFENAIAVTGNPANVQYIVGPAPSFYDWYISIFNKTGQVGGNTELISRLLSTEILEQKPEEVSKVVLSVATSIGLEFNFVAGGAVSKVNPDSAGLNPAWRKTLGELVTSVDWNEGTSAAEIKSLRKIAASNLELLDTISVDHATYYNEVRRRCTFVRALRDTDNQPGRRPCMKKIHKCRSLGRIIRS
ncbi:hypothetical protein AX14_002469 [Amanita brunnescens Koide BX004]|nr:hypothetical protein AX14_002469 [Amanita brunnescens Koide BX004]